MFVHLASLMPCIWSRGDRSPARIFLDQFDISVSLEWAVSTDLASSWLEAVWSSLKEVGHNYQDRLEADTTKRRRRCCDLGQDRFGEEPTNQWHTIKFSDSIITSRYSLQNLTFSSKISVVRSLRQHSSHCNNSSNLYYFEYSYIQHLECHYFHGKSW